MIAESMRPGVNVSDLARQCGVSRGLLQTWRRKVVRESAVFVPVHVEDAPAAWVDSNDSAQTPPEAAFETSSVAKTGILEIENGGVRVRFSGPVDTGALRLVLAHVGRRV